jgi:hypothetical protein
MRKRSKLNLAKPSTAKQTLATRLAPRIALHFAMGAALGMILGICLIYFNVAGIRNTILSHVDPGNTLAVLGATLALQFGIAAALTGFVLEIEKA